MQKTMETIIKLLKETKRAGMDDLIVWLMDNGFFEAPASTKFHGAYPGGLAKHSMGVYGILRDYTLSIGLDTLGKAISPGQKPLPITENNIIIASLLHDVCKVGAYIKTKAGDGWANNPNKAKGHALLSIERIQKFIKLEQIEELIIKYHMGVFGLNEFDEKSGEYPLRGDNTLSKEERYGNSMANAWYHNPIVKLMYFCDELATLEEKAE